MMKPPLYEPVFVLLGTGPLSLLIVIFMYIFGLIAFVTLYLVKYKNIDGAILMMNRITRSTFNVMKKGSSESETVIFHYVVPDQTLFHLVIGTVFFILFSLAIFWQTFFISQEDCFSASFNDSRLLCFEGHVLLENCTLLNLNSDEYIGCYRIAFAFGSAITTAAGAFASYVVHISLQITLLVLISGGKNGSKKRKIAAVLTQVIYFIFAFVFYTALFIGSFTYINYLYQFLSNINYSVFLYCEVVFVHSTVHWWKFEKAGGKEQQKMDSGLDTLKVPLLPQNESETSPSNN